MPPSGHPEVLDTSSLSFPRTRTFRLTIINKRTHPVSLRKFQVAACDFVFPGSNSNVVHGLAHVYLLRDGGRNVDVLPVINLGPSETRMVDIVIGTIGLPTGDHDSLLNIQRQTRQLLANQVSNATVNLFLSDFLLNSGDANGRLCFPQGNTNAIDARILLSSASSNDINGLIYLPVLRDYLASGRLIQCQISAVDQTGRTVLSSKTQDRVISPGNVQLTW